MLKSTARRSAYFAYLAICWLGCVSFCAASEYRVRIQWRSDVAKAWQGTVRVLRGEFSDLALLGMLPDEATAIQLQGNELRIHSPTARLSDGADLTVSGAPDAAIVIQLSSEAGHPATEVTLPLRELAQQGRTTKLDDDGGKLTIARTPGDKLRFQCARTSLVFSPGETLNFRVAPFAVGIASGTAVKMQASLSESGESKLSWSAEKDAPFASDGELTPVDWEVTLPTAEGVYDLRIALSNPRFTDRLGVHSILAERIVQLVVIGEKPPAHTSEPLGKVFELDPANTKWWERVPPALLASTGLRRGPVGSGDAAKWQHPQLGMMTQLGSLTCGRDSWEAYPLVIAEPNQPHVLEVEFPCDVPQSLGLSILEHDGGQNYSHVDTGIVVSEADADRPATIAKQRITFWPKTKTPMLVVTNPLPTSRAVFGKLRVLGPNRNTLNLPLTKTNNTPVMLPRFADDAINWPRTTFALCERPFLSAELASDAVATEDWSTFYHGAIHLANYLEHAGYNGVMLSVAGEGSTLYPSRLRPSQRLDAGRLRGAGEDPVRKDVLEVLLRVLDRSHVRCVPMLELSGPIPELEDYLAQHDESDSRGIRWQGADENELAARYNPLSPHVQAAVLAVVREVVERYGDHEFLSGLALQLTSAGPLVLNSDGPLDDETFARFSKQTQAPRFDGKDRFAQRARYIAGSARESWLRWRAEELHRFFAKLRDEVAKLGPTATLYLVGTKLFDDPEIQAELKPGLPEQVRPAETLLRRGISLPLLAKEPQLVFMRPYQEAPLEKLTSRGAWVELGEKSDIDHQLSTGPVAGAVIERASKAMSLAGGDAIGQGLSGTLQLRPQFTSASVHARATLSRSLAHQDCAAMAIGGEAFTRGQDEAIQEWLHVFQQLPLGHYETIAPESQPIIVRKLVRDEETYLYVLNDSAWPVHVRVPLEMSREAASEILGNSGDSRTEPRLTSDGWEWSLPLAPYDLAAVKLATSTVRVGKLKVNLDENIALHLRRKVQELGARAAALSSPPPYQALANAGFEQPVQGTNIPGWIATGSVNENITTDSHGHTGGAALRLHTDSKEPTLVQSIPFTAPATGRLAVSAWLRSDSGDRQTTLRMGVIGGAGNEGFARFAEIGPHSGSGGRLSERWAPFQFEVNDLPSDSNAELRVQFEVSGEGDVCIDDVQTCALSFTETEQVELTKLIALMNLKLESGQIRDCENLMSGYWPQFLFENVQLVHSTAANGRRGMSTEKARDITPNSAIRRANVLDRVKDMVPRLKR